jgi:hypothetical protein
MDKSCTCILVNLIILLNWLKYKYNNKIFTQTKKEFEK